MSYNPTTGGMSIGGTVTSGTAGSIPYIATGPVLAQDNSNLFWDSTNKRFSIGRNAPSDTCELDSTATHGPVIVQFTSGTKRGYFGPVGAANNLINGSAAGDYCLRTEGGDILFSRDAGTTIISSLKSDGQRLNGANATSNSRLTWQVASSDWSYIGVAGGNNSQIAGSVIGDLCLATFTGSILFSTDYGSSLAFGIKSGKPKFIANAVGSGSALLGANCPAVTVTAPYTWVTVLLNDGSTAYIPTWK